MNDLPPTLSAIIQEQLLMSRQCKLKTLELHTNGITTVRIAIGWLKV